MDVLEGRQSNATRNVKFKSAESDYTQDGFPDANAIDGKTDTGWGIGGPGGGPKHRHAIFSLAEPLDLENAANVSIRLVQKFGKQHTLGRFRVSFGQELPDKVITLERRRELRDKRCQVWLAAQLPDIADWKTLRPAFATSSTPTLTIEDDDSVFASGDFTKNDTYTLKFHNLR